MSEFLFDAPTNYAKAAGIESFPLALIFCGIYVPLFIIFFTRWCKNSNYVLGIATLFSIIRVTAFGMRAALTKSDSLADDKKFVMAQSIIYSVGYFGVLSSAINLVIDREEASGINNRDPLRFITANRVLTRMALMGAVIVGIIGSIHAQDSSDPDKVKSGHLLRKISIIIFLVMACLLVIHTLFAVMGEKKAAPFEKPSGNSLGEVQGMKILLLTGSFLVLRELFYAVTLNDLAKQEEEKLFYPFAAVTELLAVLTFLIPGLVPPKHELPR